ncbi:hypothetical protein ZWY2020_008180 [Hordeum vulgare]|nr:hypothetical protein ZWY2020_008180 [Hordeum vulgare]
MEDLFLRPEFLPGHHFFGVFDGHGCSHVATSCGERMHEIVADEARSSAQTTRSGGRASWRGASRGWTPRPWAQGQGPAAPRQRPTAGASCSCPSATTSAQRPSSPSSALATSSSPTAVTAAVICRGGAAIPLSSDHKPDRPDELERIQAAGGRVIFWDGARVFGVLAMSRAIGDSYLKPFVIPDPEVRVLERKDGEDEFLILASDGLWDVVSNEVACHVVRSCVRSKAKRRGGRSSPTSNLSPRQSSGSGSSSGDEAQNESGGCAAGAGSESDDEEVDEACAEAAILLTKLAIARQSPDNVSVVVVNLRRRPRF